MYNKIQNKTKQIKRKMNFLQDRLEQFKKRQSLLEKGLWQITKMQNQLQDELEQIAEMSRIKNYEKMLKEVLIISLSKSKSSLAELFNNNLDNDKISEIKDILTKLRDILIKEYRKKIKKKKTI